MVGPSLAASVDRLAIDLPEWWAALQPGRSPGPLASGGRRHWGVPCRSLCRFRARNLVSQPTVFQQLAHLTGISMAHCCTCRWKHIDQSPAWQRGAFDGLALAYGILAVVALVRTGLATRTHPPHTTCTCGVNSLHGGCRAGSLRQRAAGHCPAAPAARAKPRGPCPSLPRAPCRCRSPASSCACPSLGGPPRRCSTCSTSWSAGCAARCLPSAARCRTCPTPSSRRCCSTCRVGARARRRALPALPVGRRRALGASARGGRGRLGVQGRRHEHPAHAPRWRPVSWHGGRQPAVPAPRPTPHPTPEQACCSSPPTPCWCCSGRRSTTRRARCPPAACARPSWS